MTCRAVCTTVHVGAMKLVNLIALIVPILASEIPYTHANQVSGAAIEVLGHMQHPNRSSIAETKTSASYNGEERYSPEVGLMSAIFTTPSGGRIDVFLPTNIRADEAQIGGTVERYLPPSSTASGQDAPSLAESELSGVVTIQPQPQGPPRQCSLDATSFTSISGTSFKITYQPPVGPPCSTMLNAPQPLIS